eukprot:SAG31_NODE_2769_length_5117_cov_1.964727_4_plen_148_part_00
MPAAPVRSLLVTTDPPFHPCAMHANVRTRHWSKLFYHDRCHGTAVCKHVFNSEILNLVLWRKGHLVIDVTYIENYIMEYNYFSISLLISIIHIWKDGILILDTENYLLLGYVYNSCAVKKDLNLNVSEMFNVFKIIVVFTRYSSSRY